VQTEQETDKTCRKIWSILAEDSLIHYSKPSKPYFK